MLPYSNGSPQFMVLKKQPTPWDGAVAFLMLSFLTGLHDTDHGHDNTDHRNYNTDSANHCFYHLCTFR